MSPPLPLQEAWKVEPTQGNVARYRSEMATI